MPARIGAPACGFDSPEECQQFIEVQLADIVNILAGNREQQPGCAQPRSVAVRAGAFDHHLVQPVFHPRIRFAPLPVPSITAFDASCDAAKAHLFTVAVVPFLFRIGRSDNRYLFLVCAVQDRVPRGFG